MAVFLGLTVACVGRIQCGGTSLYDTVLRLVGLGRDFSRPRVNAVGNLFLALRRGEVRIHTVVVAHTYIYLFFYFLFTYLSIYH